MNDTILKNIVAFCILMQGNGGIISKSPAYIEEKFTRYCQSEIEHEYEWGLDDENKKKLKEWIDKWRVIRKGSV